MSGTYDCRGVRRRAAALGLIGFPLALLANAAIDEGAGDAAQMLQVVESPERLFAAAATLVLSAVLTPAAAHAVVHLVRDRGARLAHWGAALLTLGAFGHMGIATLYVVLLGGVRGGETAAMEAMLTRLNSSPALVLVFPLILAFGLGVVLSAVALWRGGVLGAWAPSITVAALVLHLTPVPDGLVGDAVGLAKNLAVLVVYGALGLRVLNMSNDQWQAAAGAETGAREHANPAPAAATTATA